MATRPRGTIALLASLAASLIGSVNPDRTRIVEDAVPRDVSKKAPRHLHDKDAWKKSRPTRFRPKHNRKNFGGPRHRW